MLVFVKTKFFIDMAKKEEFIGLPAVQIELNTLKLMTGCLSNEQIGQIIRCVLNATEGEKEYKLNDIEAMFFQQLWDYAHRKAIAWYKQTSNFRDNNPRTNK